MQLLGAVKGGAKSRARRLRDHPVLNPLIRAPFAALRDLGIDVPQRITQHLSFRGPFEVSVPGGGHFRMQSHGHAVENNIYWHGLAGHEPESVSAWMACARQSSVVLDIGANTGFYSLLTASLAKHASVHAFEPVPRIADLLEQNVKLNPSFDIRVHRAAVGPKPGTAEIHDPGGDNCYSASLNADFLDADKATYPVQVHSIDALVESENIERLDLIKLDVEGFEAPALRGMKASLERFRPTLMMEFLSADDTELVAEIESLMSSGYALYHLEAAGPRRVSTIEPSRGGFNVLLHPADKALPEI